MRGAALVYLAVASACASSQPPASLPVETGERVVASDSVAAAMLVDVRSVAPGILVEMRYATANNFTGAPLPGYFANRALLRREAAAALGRVQRRLAGEGMALLVYDAYRPVRATEAMMAWTRRAGREDLVRDGYIASRSRHNLGLAIDVTLVDMATRQPLDMGTAYDVFDTAAHTANAAGAARANRLRLVRAMEAEGFANYDREWWHFAFAAQPELRFDMEIR